MIKARALLLVLMASFLCHQDGFAWEETISERAANPSTNYRSFNWKMIILQKIMDLMPLRIRF